VLAVVQSSFSLSAYYVASQCYASNVAITLVNCAVCYFLRAPVALARAHARCEIHWGLGLSLQWTRQQQRDCGRAVGILLLLTASYIFAVLADCIVYVRVFFLCQHDNSWTAARSLMKFCTNLYFNNRTNPIKFQGHMSKVKVIFS